MRGFDFESSTRSSLGWEMIRLLKEVKEKPKYVIFENVAMITSKKFKDTLNLFKEDLTSLGYTLYDDVLSATDYGIPQTRKRYFLVAILDKEKKFEFPKKAESNIKLKDLLESDVEEKYYLTGSDYIENDKKRIFRNKNREYIEYEVDMEKYFNGGVCGIDKHTKLFSIHGNSPTLTASNTSDNSKIVVESGGK